MLTDPLLAPSRLLDVAHVAHRLFVSQRFVCRLIRDGKLPAIRLGRVYRVDPADLQAFIEAQRIAAAEAKGDRPRPRLHQPDPPAA